MKRNVFVSLLALQMAASTLAPVFPIQAATQPSVGTTAEQATAPASNVQSTNEITAVIPNDYDDSNFKNYTVNMTGTTDDCRRLIKVSVKKNGILNVLYSIEKCNNTFVRISIFKDSACTTRVSPKFAYSKNTGTGTLAQYLRKGEYYVLIETGTTGNQIALALAFAHAEVNSELLLDDTARYVNSGTTQYFNFTLESAQLLQLHLAKYDSDNGFYFSICDENKNVISSRYYRKDKSKTYFALHKGKYYLKVTPKNGNSDSVFYLATTTNHYAGKNNISTDTALEIETDKKYTDVLYNGDAITTKAVYKLEVDKPISVKIKTNVRFGGNAYIGLSGVGISQNILQDYQILQKGTYYLTFSKRSVSDGGIIAFKVLKK